MSAYRFGRIFAAQILLSLGVAAAAHASFQIRHGRLFHREQPFTIRGVVYSNAPIGQGWSDRLTTSGCFYARDFPLIAGAGANTIRTLAMIPPGDRGFRRSLEESNLYWLAGFPLDRFYDPRQSLSADSAQGVELRSRILAEFREYVAGWAAEPRLIGFVFGEEVGASYQEKFSGPVSDFYSLLQEAAIVLEEASGDEAPLLTTAVSSVEEIGSFVNASDDPSQPGLAFWSVNRLGDESLESLFLEIRNKTSKPFLVSAFGIDAYDGSGQETGPQRQADSARARALDVQVRADGNVFPVLGGVWDEFVDQWWRGEAPAQHDTSGLPAANFPGCELNPEWMGLFETTAGGLPGFDALRPRPAYFALAEQWGGRPPPGLSVSGAPEIDPGGAVNLASGQPLVAPGGLVAFRGSGLASAPHSASATELSLQLGAVSACVDAVPAPLLSAEEQEIRGQLPWEVAPGSRPAIVYRAGLPSDATPVEVTPFAPGIFARGVFRPGLPCPVNERNGVLPGTYLEVYSTGLGPVSGGVVSGLAPSEALTTSEQPQAKLADQPLPVLYSGALPGVAGVYQTNVQVPEDFPASLVELGLTQGGVVSNARPLRVIDEQQSPTFTLTGPEPNTVTVQQGGPAQTAYVEIEGANSFCELVRFRVNGLPAGVHATIPVGVPGERLPLSVRADAGAPLLSGITATLTGFSTLPVEVTRSFQVTVLPSRTEVNFRVISGGYKSKAPVASFEMDGNLLYEVEGGGPGRGFNFLTVDDSTGTLEPVRNFDTFEREEDVEAMENYLLSLPIGVVVLGAIADEGAHLLTGHARQVIEDTLGAELIEFVGFQHSWAIITRKNSTKPIAEGLSPNGRVVLERTLSFPLP